MTLPKIPPDHRNLLIAATVGSKVAILLVSVLIFHLYIDNFDFTLYRGAVENVLMGNWPWANNIIFYYPPVSLVPMLLAHTLSPALGDGDLGFMLGMWILMVICDIITTLCVYLVGIRMYSERTALLAALLSATAISASYYTLTRFDAFPVCLASLALLATVYGDADRGYILAVAGFLAKIWPILLYPLLWLYHAKDSSLLREGRRGAIIIAASTMVIFAAMLGLGYDRFLGYAGLVYAQTLPYLIYSCIILISPEVPFKTVGTASVVLVGGILAGTALWMYRKPKDIATLVKAILLSVFAVAYLLPYQSPQYITWITPFAVLLVAGDLAGMLSFIGVQVLGYVEFPLTVWMIWTNESYRSPWAIPFFALFFALYGVMLWRAIRNIQPNPTALGGNA